MYSGNKSGGNSESERQLYAVTELQVEFWDMQAVEKIKSKMKIDLMR